MSILIALAAAGAISLLIILSLWLSARTAERTKSGRVCLTFQDQAVFLDFQSDLQAIGVSASTMEWSPSRSAYRAVGSAQHAPLELWIDAEEWSRVHSDLSSTYAFTQLAHAFEVSKRAN